MNTECQIEDVGNDGSTERSTETFDELSRVALAEVSPNVNVQIEVNLAVAKATGEALISHR